MATYMCGQRAASVRPACGRHAAVRFLSYPRAGMAGRIDEKELSHMGKNNEHPNLVCEKTEIYQEY